MNKDKIIKDLKKRNAKLKEQYELRDIRCIYLEQENEKLKEDIIKKEKLINSLNDFNYKLKQQYELLELNYLRKKKESKELEEELEKYNKIKEMFKSGVVDLVELKNIVLGDEENERK